MKVTKRLLEDNVGIDGTLNNDNIVRALFQQRNTPDRICKLSPPGVLFGRTLRDAMPQLNKSVIIHDSDQIHSQWHKARGLEEIKSRMILSCEELERGSRELEPLREGDKVFIQNKMKECKPNKWDRQGTVIAVKDNDQCLVEVDGSERLTLRNRRFLRKFESEHYYQLTEDEMRDSRTIVEESSSNQKMQSTDMTVPVEEANKQQDNDAMIQTDVHLVMDKQEAVKAHPPPQCQDPVCASPIGTRSSTRHSTREKMQRKFYDATTGTFVDPTH